MSVSYSAETWRAAPEPWSRYEVSDKGRVRRAVDGPGTHAGRVLKLRQSGRYMSATLTKLDGTYRPVSVHWLVAAAFLGPCPGEYGRVRGQYHIDHINGDGRDNRPENLRWATPAENEANKARLGRTARGSRHGWSRLTEADVREIRAAYARGVSQLALARRYGIGQTQVSNIVTRKQWGHI